MCVCGRARLEQPPLPKQQSTAPHSNATCGTTVVRACVVGRSEAAATQKEAKEERREERAFSLSFYSAGGVGCVGDGRGWDWKARRERHR